MMMQKASNFKKAIERMHIACQDTDHLVCPVFKSMKNYLPKIGIYP
jgi:hypothetical protein